VISGDGSDAVLIEEPSFSPLLDRPLAGTPTRPADAPDSRSALLRRPRASRRGVRKFRDALAADREGRRLAGMVRRYPSPALKESLSRAVVGAGGVA
jgi:hypothetical protein